MTSEPSLVERLKEFIDSGKLELPVVSSAALRLQALAAEPDFDMNEVERLVQSDQTLAAEVLRAANSAFYAGLTQIRTIRAAVVRLSIHRVSRLVFLASERSKYRAESPELARRIQALWLHASATATGAHWLLRRLNFRKLEDAGFLGGLLHDVGHLVILRALDGIQAEQKIRLDTDSELVDEVLTAMHAELGHQFLKGWNIPDIYCRIARDHHAEEFDPTDTLIVAVRLANRATSKLGMSLIPESGLILNSLPEAQCLGTSDVLLAEMEIMLEDAISEWD